MVGLRERVGKSETRTDAVDADIGNIPELIRPESRLMDSRFAGLQAEMDARFDRFDKKMDGLERRMEAQSEAVMRAISEIVAGRSRPG